MLRNLIPLVLACGFVLGEAVPLQAQSEADSAETEPSQREELTTDFISRRLKLIEASSLLRIPETRRRGTYASLTR